MLSIVTSLQRWLIEIFWSLRSFPNEFLAWYADHKNRNFYNCITEKELRTLRKSNTVFICGTGYSILSITTEEWARIGEHDVLSFRDFPRQNYVNVDFHVTGEVDDIDQYAYFINSNHLYDKTTFLVQEGMRAVMGNRLLGWRKLSEGRKVFRYKRRGRGMMIEFSRSFSRGVVHGFGSITGMVNIAYLLGWKNIVLVGIDLYDHRYFFMPPNKSRDVEKSGITYSCPFTQAGKIVDQISLWRDLMRAEGVNIYAYNPRSLLANRISVFDWKFLNK